MTKPYRNLAKKKVKEVSYTVSPRREELRQGGPVAGTVVEPCSMCEEPCFVSPRTMEFWKKHPMPLLCFRCAMIIKSRANEVSTNWAIGDGVPIPKKGEEN